MKFSPVAIGLNAKNCPHQNHENLNENSKKNNTYLTALGIVVPKSVFIAHGSLK